MVKCSLSMSCIAESVVTAVTNTPFKVRASIYQLTVLEQLS